MNILITGGASGLGEAITRRSALAVNNNVYFTYSQSLTNAQQIEADYPNTTAIKCDFKDKNDIAGLVNKIAELDLDILVNNAYTGQFLASHFHKTQLADFVTSFNDNIVPTISITQAAIGVFRKKKFGKIITILSAALVNTPPIGSAVYVANKAYLEELTKIWATENIKFNITSNSISPAFMLTGLTNSIDERLIEQIINDSPSKKLLTTDEVAVGVQYLVNADQQINGVNLVINSGKDIH
ncbi:MAG: SDR family oxidoreductase [Bacteroidota bacterium]